MKSIEWQDVGKGWRTATIVLAEGETAPNPASTKGPIYGPCTVNYAAGPSGGIKVQVTA